uniref:hypothetical protein n=1 Tax=Gemmiger formicilis TaxID=745368 RepID=UPI0040294A8D
MPGPHASVSLSANLKQQHSTPTTPATSASTRAGIELNLDTLYYSFSTFQRAIKSSTLSITRLNGFYCGVKLWYFPH